jgi:hypothetical protein
MGTRISDPGHVTLYDSVDGVAFGPVFGDSFEAQEFLEWLRERDGRDPREMNARALSEKYTIFTVEREDGVA